MLLTTAYIAYHTHVFKNFIPILVQFIIIFLAVYRQIFVFSMLYIYTTWMSIKMRTQCDGHYFLWIICVVHIMIALDISTYLYLSVIVMCVKLNVKWIGEFTNKWNLCENNWVSLPPQNMPVSKSKYLSNCYALLFVFCGQAEGFSMTILHMHKTRITRYKFTAFSSIFTLERVISCCSCCW